MNRTNKRQKYQTLEEINHAADIENQPDEIRGLLLRPMYTMGNESLDALDKKEQ